VCILPDSAVRYLSKIFNDTWMKEGGYLDPLEKAAPGDSFGKVITQMKERGFSQLPVIGEDGRVMGLISESDLLMAMLDKRATRDTPIDAWLDNGFALVEVHNRTSLLSQLFAQRKVVVVEDAGRVVGILTNIDFIDWISSRLAR
jgi:cystathionine beta-synthase